MKWIEQVSEYDGHPAGEQWQADDAVADVLVKTKTSKSCAVPAEVATANVTVDPADIASFSEKLIASALAKMPGQGAKRFRFVDDPADKPVIKEWATARRCGALKNFPNTDQGRETAFRMGKWFLGIVYRSMPQMFGGLKNSAEWCGKNIKHFGLFEPDQKAQGENVNTAGGFLVAPEIDDVLIDLREMYGMFRQFCPPTPMKEDTKWVNRRKSGVTANFIGENAAITDSTKSWDQVQLVAKKLGALCYYSSELDEDAIINIGDDIASEIAWAFALKEDQCGFVGDGTSTYGGIRGIQTVMLAVDATIANILGLQVGAAGTGANWGGFVLADFNATLGRLPQFAYAGRNVKWYTSQAFWGQTMQRLATAGGGNKVSDIVDGVPQFEFLGFPVKISQVMPAKAATNNVVCWFGDLSMAASFGDRRKNTIKVSDVGGTAFANDQIAVRGTERFDIVIHDVGESSATPASQARDPAVGPLAGPLVGLITASS